MFSPARPGSLLLLPLLCHQARLQICRWILGCARSWNLSYGARLGRRWSGFRPSAIGFYRVFDLVKELPLHARNQLDVVLFAARSGFIVVGVLEDEPQGPSFRER